MLKLLLLIVTSLFFLSGFTSTKLPSEKDSFSSQTVKQLKSGIQSKHPVTYLELAGQLLNSGKNDEAVIWYYIGQIRYRAYLMANPDLEPSGDPAVYSSLKYILGIPINEYAGSNPDNWLILIENALEWHRENPNHFTPKRAHVDIYSEIELGFNQFKTKVESSKEEIRKQRAKNGLRNN